MCCWRESPSAHPERSSGLGVWQRMCARVHDVRAHVCLCVCSLFTCVTGRPPGTHQCGRHGPPGRGPLACSPAGRPGRLAGLGLAPCSRPPAAGARLRAPPPPAGVEGCTGSPSLGARALSPRPFPPQDMPCQRFPLLALAGLLSLGSGESCRTFRVRKDGPTLTPPGDPLPGAWHTRLWFIPPSGSSR